MIIGTPTPTAASTSGKPDGSPGQFGYAIDSAFGDSGIYVLELNEN